MFYQEEYPAESRARRDRDIYTLYRYLFYERGMSAMETYKAVGYVFYLSAEQIRRIIRQYVRIGHHAHNALPNSPYFCTVIQNFMRMNTQDKQTIKEFDGYVCLDTDGAVWFMDTYPVLQRTHRERVQPDGSVQVADYCSFNNSNGHYDMFLGFDDEVKSGISVGKPVPAVLQVLVKS